MDVRRFTIITLLTVWALTGCGAGGQGPGGDPGEGSKENEVEPGPPHYDTIAYVPGAGRDEIRAVRPDGTEDRRLWAHGRGDPLDTAAIWDLSWSPDARELAFTSTHEYDCSLMSSDVYTVGTHGLGLSRMSLPPSCDALEELPKASVTMPVQNLTLDSLDIFIYFAGASSAKQVSLPPGGSGTVLFDEVADLGDVVQYAMLVHADGRELLGTSGLDVQPGGSHTLGLQQVWKPGSPGWEARSPTWSADGSRLGYVYGFNDIYAQGGTTQPLTFGTELLMEGDPPSTIFHLEWGPVARPDEVLYVGWSFEGRFIYHAEEGASAPGTPLLEFEAYENVFGLDWLPDGSGFVFSYAPGAFGENADLWAYSFASGTATRITSFSGEYAGELSVSPDGSRIVFERSTELREDGWMLVDPDLWVVNRDGSGLTLLVEGAGSPDWSPAE